MMSVIKPKNLGTLTLLLTPLNAIRESRIKPFRLSMPKTALALATGKDMPGTITKLRPMSPAILCCSLTTYIRLSLHALHTQSYTNLFFSLLRRNAFQACSSVKARFQCSKLCSTSYILIKLNLLPSQVSFHKTQFINASRSTFTIPLGIKQGRPN